MTIQAEIYVDPRSLGQQVSDEDVLRQKELEDLQKLADDIGMQSLKEADARRYRKLQYPQNLEALSSEAYAVWEAWLPMTYRTDSQFQRQRLGYSPRNLRDWQSYSYDHIPLQVRELIRDVKPHFDMLEVRTPERVPDPALFGWIGEKVYLLARWGESDERLLSFEQIRDGLQAHESVRLLNERYNGCFVGGFALSGYLTMVSYAFSNVLSFSVLAASSIFVFFVLFCVILRYKSKSKIARLQQAYPWAFQGF